MVKKWYPVFYDVFYFIFTLCGNSYEIIKNYLEKYEKILIFFAESAKKRLKAISNKTNENNRK